MRLLLRMSPLPLIVATVLAADGPRLVYMDDIGQWTAEMYAGNSNGRAFVQGPKLQTWLSGIIVFDSKGNGYVACESFIALVTKDGQAQVLTGQPWLAGNTDGPPGRGGQWRGGLTSRLTGQPVVLPATIAHGCPTTRKTNNRPVSSRCR